jgi:hypothetical protein
MTGTTRRPGPALPSALIAFALALGTPAATLAHGPDPILGTGTLWSRDEVVRYQWNDIYGPPTWMATAIDLGAGDVAESRSSRAATFMRAADAPAVIAYSGPFPCPSYGIACADRTGLTDNVFHVFFRPQGFAFDWGTLKWCQSYATAPNGCYDAERVALDELGHIEVLGHHVNFADESDYLDAVVQYAGRQKPNEGWNVHAFGRCDVARLQLEYERRDPSNPVSTCLGLASVLTTSASTTYLVPGNSVRFTANLKLASSAAAEAMSGDPLSDRTIVLQRRAVGGATWSTVGTMASSTTAEGAYGLTIYPAATYDYRVTFSSPSNEGVSGSTSGIVRVTVASCSSSCPLSATRGSAK